MPALRKQDLPTPALVLDAEMFERNLERMQQHAAASGKRLRPHAKAHKCVEVARLQVAVGACGVCVATVDEMSWMVGAKLPGVLLTSPLASAEKMARVAAWSQEHGVMAVADHPVQVSMWQAVAVTLGARLDLLVDLDVGDHRTGIACGEPALALARAIAAAPNLRLRGVQAYSVSGSHMEDPEARRIHSLNALRPAMETVQAMRADGLPVEIVSGASTGTWEIDTEVPELTELQAGSYIFHDLAYSRIGVSFEPALRVLATVISANHDGRATVDAGFKALSTDRPFPPEPYGLPGVRFQFAGDEFGFLLSEEGSPPRLGGKVELLPPHIDPTVNLHSRIHVCYGDIVEEIWPLKQ
ncbi:MAG: DSD1 family PLP-dependent enzyme [Bryobacterales bacterium]|nr:DSD1 family PLP-dependent enzyme [Bryobacterales bacterium]